MGMIFFFSSYFYIYSDRDTLRRPTETIDVFVSADHKKFIKRHFLILWFSDLQVYMDF